MSTVITENLIELRKAGNRALNSALGHNRAQIFLKLCKGDGDFTKERHEEPERLFDEIVADVMQLQEEQAEVIAAKNNGRCAL